MSVAATEPDANMQNTLHAANHHQSEALFQRHAQKRNSGPVRMLGHMAHYKQNIKIIFLLCSQTQSLLANLKLNQLLTRLFCDETGLKDRKL